MKNRRIAALLALLAAVVVFVAYQRLQPLLRTMPIGAAYAAKTVCSGVFLSGRDPADIIRDDLVTIPFVSENSIAVDRNAKTVDARLLFSTVRAVYRENCGCTLVVGGITEDEIRGQNTGEPLPRPSLSDELLWPDGERVDTASAAVGREALDKAIDYAFDEPFSDKRRGTRALVVVHNGHIVAEQYAAGFRHDMPLTSWSMTKTVTGVLLGILAGDGLIDLHGAAPIPEWRQGGDPRGTITTDQLMRMSSGLQFVEEYGAVPSDVVVMLHEQASAGRFAASFPLAHDPDTVWYYSSGTTNILSRIVRDAINEDMAAYVRFPRERLFDKLGMTTAVMELDPAGVSVGSSFMYCSPRDWARVGLFLLQDGVWNGERILPEGWVKYMRTPTPTAPQAQYGAQLWLNGGTEGDRFMPDAPDETFYLSGFEGQRVIVVPSRNAVIVRMGLMPDDSALDWNELVKLVLAALPQNAETSSSPAPDTRDPAADETL